MKKSLNKIKKFITENIVSIVSLLAGVILGVAIMFAFWPTRIATLKDGTQVVAEVNGKVFTADDLYNQYKSETGASVLINLIDDYILHNKYSLEREANEFAESQSKEIYTSYQNYYGYTKEQFLSGNGFENEEAFLNYLKDQFYYQHYYDEYVSSTITDKEIKDYYNKSVFGNKHIYYFTSTKADDLNKIKSDLKNGVAYSKIQATYTDVTCQDIESISFDTDGNYSADALSLIASTSKGKSSEVFSDASTNTSFLVYVVDEEDKPKLEDIKSKVVDKLVDQKQSNDETLYYKAYIALRKEYGLKFSDTTLEKEYEKLIKDYK